MKTEHLEQMLSHAGRDYPSECCGMMLGKSDGEAKVVSEIREIRNLRHDPSKAQSMLPLDSPETETDRNRFLIDPREQIRVEKSARDLNLDVIGYYHSHPDHPARPSQYDRDHAWPWYSYVIIQVIRGKAGEFTSWVLAEDRSRFDDEAVEVIA
ncbi:MAG TPA: M67 family metallopeptidase [Terriglobia bacterium]|nr:M67 family metallopeptidase [Terriglobia bacterium]